MIAGCILRTCDPSRRAAPSRCARQVRRGLFCLWDLHGLVVRHPSSSPSTGGRPLPASHVAVRWAPAYWVPPAPTPVSRLRLQKLHRNLGDRRRAPRSCGHCRTFLTVTALVARMRVRQAVADDVDGLPTGGLVLTSVCPSYFLAAVFLRAAPLRDVGVTCTSKTTPGSPP